MCGGSVMDREGLRFPSTKKKKKKKKKRSVFDMSENPRGVTDLMVSEQNYFNHNDQHSTSTERDATGNDEIIEV